MDELAGRGAPIQPLPRHTAVLAHPGVAADRPEPPHGGHVHGVGVGHRFLQLAQPAHPAAATVPEVLRERATPRPVGKWHLAPPIDQTTSVGPFDQWPLGQGLRAVLRLPRGFTDQFFPELVCDNTGSTRPATPEEGYHLSEDLVDQSIAWLGDQSRRREKPFFPYLAFGPPTHRSRRRAAPGAVPGRVRPRLGRRPEGAAAPARARHRPRRGRCWPRQPRRRAVGQLDDDDGASLARLQEAFAAVIDHTDVQLGRVVAHLGESRGSTTRIVVCSPTTGPARRAGPVGYVITSRRTTSSR